MRCLIVVIAVLFAVPAAAQVESRPTPPPIVTAENDAWYLAGQPLSYEGSLYYPAGPDVFFNGNTMVRTGNFNGVPLYADTTLEPYSIVYVPIARGLMQPYESPRRGDLAGTTGSRMPSFPVGGVGPIASAPTSPAVPAPTAPPAIGTSGDGPEAGTVGTAGVLPRRTPPITTVVPPRNNDGIWVRYHGEKWVSSGAAIPLGSSNLVMVGQYAGFPVYAAKAGADVIYLPSRDGFVAPYSRNP